MPTNSAVNEAVRLLTPSHRELTKNDYGRPIVGGFSVSDGVDGTARISHTTVEPDLLDPDRPTDDELAAARHRMVNAYAQTLEAAGWKVIRRGSRSRKPYLLASR